MDAMSIRSLQIVLLSAALVMGLAAPVFNGLSLLALVFLGATYYLGVRYGKRTAS
jgi:hypothetical protein